MTMSSPRPWDPWWGSWPALALPCPTCGQFCYRTTTGKAADVPCEPQRLAAVSAVVLLALTGAGAN